MWEPLWFGCNVNVESCRLHIFMKWPDEQHLVRLTITSISGLNMIFFFFCKLV